MCQLLYASSQDALIFLPTPKQYHKYPQKGRQSKNELYDKLNGK